MCVCVCVCVSICVCVCVYGCLFVCMLSVTHSPLDILYYTLHSVSSCAVCFLWCSEYRVLFTLNHSAFCHGYRNSGAVRASLLSLLTSWSQLEASEGMRLTSDHMSRSACRDSPSSSHMVAKNSHCNVKHMLWEKINACGRTTEEPKQEENTGISICAWTWACWVHSHYHTA